MKHLILAPALLIATAAFAHEGVKNPDVMARMELMKDIAGDMKVLGEMAKGVTAYDGAIVKAKAASLSDHAGATIRLFETPAYDAKSEATTTIWTSFPDFAERASAMGKAAKALEVASEAEFQAAFAKIGKTCSSCHKSYRMKN